MNPFNDFSNYQELLRSMSYKDIAQFCRTNSQFRNICNSARGKEIIAEVLERSIEKILNNLPLDLLQILDRNLWDTINNRPSKLGTTERIQQLIDEYYNTQTEVAIEILRKKNYSRQFYRDLYQYFKNSPHARVHRTRPIYQKETGYTPLINELLTYLNQYGYTYPGPLIIELIQERDPTVDMSQYQKEVDQTFLRRHPELLEFFGSINYDDYIDDDVE